MQSGLATSPDSPQLLQMAPNGAKGWVAWTTLMRGVGPQDRTEEAAEKELAHFGCAHELSDEPHGETQRENVDERWLSPPIGMNWRR